MIELQIYDEKSALASPSILQGEFGPTSWINDGTWFTKHLQTSWSLDKIFNFFGSTLLIISIREKRFGGEVRWKDKFSKERLKLWNGDSEGKDYNGNYNEKRRNQ